MGAAAHESDDKIDKFAQLSDNAHSTRCAQLWFAPGDRRGTRLNVSHSTADTPPSFSWGHEYVLNRKFHHWIL